MPQATHTSTRWFGGYEGGGDALAANMEYTDCRGAGRSAACTVSVVSALWRLFLIIYDGWLFIAYARHVEDERGNVVGTWYSS